MISIDCPKVSIITVCYNAVNSIENTIMSVVNQTYCNVEYIIIDGGSNDGTKNVIDKYKKHLAYWISEPDNGIYDAMNKGLAKASGEWVNFMNAGDSFASNDVVEKFISQILPETVIAYGNANMIKKEFQYIQYPFPLCFLKSGMPFCHQATFIRTTYHKEHLFDTSFKSSGDYNFFYSAYFYDMCQFQYIPCLIVDFNDYEGMSKNHFDIMIRENCRIWQAGRFSFTRLKSELSICLYRFKAFIKLFIPKKLLLKNQIRSVEHLGCKVIIKPTSR